MTISITNRQRIALLFFFVLDNMLWYWAAFYSTVFWPYIVAGTAVHGLAFAALVASFYKRYYFKITASIISLYCFLMIPLTAYGSESISLKYHTPTVNVLWFKTDKDIPIEGGLASMLFYMYLLFFLYWIAWKHMKLPPAPKR